MLMININDNEWFYLSRVSARDKMKRIHNALDICLFCLITCSRNVFNALIFVYSLCLILLQTNLRLVNFSVFFIAKFICAICSKGDRALNTLSIYIVIVVSVCNH